MNTIDIHHSIVDITTYIEASVCTVNIASKDFTCII